MRHLWSCEIGPYKHGHTLASLQDGWRSQQCVKGGSRVTTDLRRIRVITTLNPAIASARDDGYQALLDMAEKGGETDFLRDLMREQKFKGVSAMKRRDFLTTAGAATLGTAAGSFPTPAISQNKRQWRMLLAWPKNLPGAGTAAQQLGKAITELSDGRLEVEVFGAGELAPAFSVFEAVREGKAEMGHSMAYYWIGKDPVFAFFAAVPGGLMPGEQNAWLYYGGGQELWDEVYADYGLKPFPAGTFATQMGGWFLDPINSVDDLKGLKVRISGLTGEVYNRLGATTVQLPAAEIMPALQAGTVDGAEWVGGWNDLAFGFPQVAQLYYGPGPQEGGATLECTINKQAWDELPNDLKTVVAHACKSANMDMLSAYTYHDTVNMKTLVTEHGVELKRFPDDVRDALFTTSNEVVEEVAESSDHARRIVESYKKYRELRMDYGPWLEQGFLNSRKRF